MPDPPPAPRMPKERVIVEVTRGPQALTATMPLPGKVGRGGTVPLGAGEIRDAVEALMGALEPSVPRETPPSITRSTPPDLPAAPVVRPRRYARSFAILLALALVASALTWIVVLRAIGVHREPAAIVEAPPLSSVTAAPAPEPEPEPVPVPVPVPAPAPAPTAVKRPSPQPKPANPIPSAAPAPKFTPLFGG